MQLGFVYFVFLPSIVTTLLAGWAVVHVGVAPEQIAAQFLLELTELGQRMLPLLRQCYDSALGARSLASAMKSGEVATLRIALSNSVDVALLMPHLLELHSHYRSLEIKLLRGNRAAGRRPP